MSAQGNMQVKSNGSTFNCRVDGARGPWVLLSHGLATDIGMGDELADALKERYRVLRYDARGHGGSAATEGDYTLDQLEMAQHSRAHGERAGVVRAQVAGERTEQLRDRRLDEPGEVLEHPLTPERAREGLAVSRLLGPVRREHVRAEHRPHRHPRILDREELRVTGHLQREGPGRHDPRAECSVPADGFHGRNPRYVAHRWRRSA